MLMTHRLLVTALLISSIGAAFAQNLEVSTPQIHSLKEGLASHGLTDLSEESLIAALSHSDPHVRTMAAMKLEEDHHDDAAPAIESALSREQDINAQIGLSEALWGLHDDHGIAHLRAMCRDSSLGFITLISVRDKAGTLFGFERWAALSTEPAEEIARAAEVFGQDDDITVLTLCYAGIHVPV